MMTKPLLLSGVKESPRKLDIGLFHDPAVSLIGIHPNDSVSYRRDTCSSMLTAALFTIANKWKESRCPSTDGQIMIQMAYLHKRVLFSY